MRPDNLFERGFALARHGGIRHITRQRSFLKSRNVRPADHDERLGKRRTKSLRQGPQH